MKNFVANSESIKITGLAPDGLLLSTHGDVRAEAGKWKVVVTMDIPKTPDRLIRELHEVITVINKLSSPRHVRDSWMSRIHRIQVDLPSFSTIHPSQNPDTHQLPRLGKDEAGIRRSRGLLDPLGVLMHDVFGLATSKEIANIRNILSTLDQNDGAIVHRIDILTSVVNRSRVYEAQNRVFINTLASRMAHGQAHLANLTRTVSELAIHISMEQVLESLELKRDTIQKLHDLYTHRRQDLHSLRLTEELLPLATLAQILRDAQSYDVIPIAETNWYYAHERVRPMWATKDFLVYEVELHMVRPAMFLLYRIQSWPVPTSDTTATHITQTGQFGYNTHTGQLFKADHCLGDSPMVCAAGALYAADFPPCVRGILKSDARLMDTCPTRITRGNASQIDYITDNEYIVSSWGEKLETRCTGKNAENLYLPRGVHNLIVSPKCSVTSASWTLSAISLHHLHVALITRELPRAQALNLSSLIHPSYSLYTPESPLQSLARIESLPLELLRAPLLKEIPWQQNSNTLQTILIVLVLLLLTLIVAYVAWHYRKHCPLDPCSSCKRAPLNILPTTHLPQSLALEKLAVGPSMSPSSTANQMLAGATDGLPDSFFREMLRNFDRQDTRRATTPNSQRKRRSRYDSDPDHATSSAPLTTTQAPTYKDLRAQLPDQDE